MFSSLFNRKSFHQIIAETLASLNYGTQTRDPEIYLWEWKLSSDEKRAQLLEIFGSWPPLPESVPYAEKDLARVEEIRQQLATPSVEAARIHRAGRAAAHEARNQWESDQIATHGFLPPQATAA